MMESSERRRDDSELCSTFLAVMAVVSSAPGAAMFCISWVLITTECNTLERDAPVVRVDRVSPASPPGGEAPAPPYADDCRVDFLYARGRYQGSLVTSCVEASSLLPQIGFRAGNSSSSSSVVGVCYNADEPGRNLIAKVDPDELPEGVIPLGTVLGMRYAGAALIGLGAVLVVASHAVLSRTFSLGR